MVQKELKLRVDLAEAMVVRAPTSVKFLMLMNFSIATRDIQSVFVSAPRGMILLWSVGEERKFHDNEPPGSPGFDWLT